MVPELSLRLLATTLLGEVSECRGSGGVICAVLSSERCSACVSPGLWGPGSRVFCFKAEELYPHQGADCYPVSRESGSEFLRPLLFVCTSNHARNPTWRKTGKGETWKPLDPRTAAGFPPHAFRDKRVGPCNGQGLPLDCDGENSVTVTVSQSVPDKNMTQPLVPAEIAPSWIVAGVLGASVCTVFLTLTGCFVLLRCVYKKAKHAIPPRNSLPQHLKEVGSRMEPGVDSETLTGSCPSKSGPPNSAQRGFLENGTHLARWSHPWCPSREV